MDALEGTQAVNEGLITQGLVWVMCHPGMPPLAVSVPALLVPFLTKQRWPVTPDAFFFVFLIKLAVGKYNIFPQ